MTLPPQGGLIPCRRRWNNPMTKEKLSELADSLSGRDVLGLFARKVKRAMGRRRPFTWNPSSVFDASGIPELACRTYLELRDLQSFMQYIRKRTPIRRSADIGCGFGRLLPLLADCSREAIGFEREKGLIEIGKKLNPNVRIIETNDLARIDCKSSYFDLVLVFTVLQHLTGKKVLALAGEINRLVRKNGFLLICEQTDTKDLFGELDSEASLLQHGRSVKEYAEIFHRFKLHKTLPRVSEPTYRRKDVGTYMLFRKR